METRKLTYTADLGWCLARGLVSTDGIPAVTVVNPHDNDGYHMPASSVAVVGEKGVKALGAICRALVPESPLHGLTLRETGGLYSPGAGIEREPGSPVKELELDFRAPNGEHFTLIVPESAAAVVAAWWKAQTEPAR